MALLLDMRETFGTRILPKQAECAMNLKFRELDVITLSTITASYRRRLDAACADGGRQTYKSSRLQMHLNIASSILSATSKIKS